MLKQLQKLQSWFIPKISWITWFPLKAFFNGGVFYDLTDDDCIRIENELKNNYCIILTRSNSRLSSYLVGLGNLIVTGKYGYWAHALMNLDESNPTRDVGYKFMEATSKGVHHSSFYDVFKCDSVALLRPKNLTSTEWNAIFERLLLQDGKKYDNMFELADDSELSCVELVRTALMALPDYEEHFSDLERLIKKFGGNLTPDMFYNCKDFDVILEIRA